MSGVGQATNDAASEIRDGLDTYWASASKYHAALDALVAERDRLLRGTVDPATGAKELCRANIELSAVNAQVVEAVRDHVAEIVRLRAALTEIAEFPESDDPNNSLAWVLSQEINSMKALAARVLAGETDQ